MKDKDFFADVYAIVKKIPRGRVTSYGAIAACLSNKGAARMVGWAMNNSHKYQDVPAHRVVNRQGLLTGKHHFPTPKAMEESLTSEGIQIKDNQILNFKNVFWNPNEEL